MQGELRALREGKKFLLYTIFLPLVSILSLGYAPGTHEECGTPVYGEESLE